MINKSLVKQRFTKSLATYDNNAIIQKVMAKKLVDLVERKSFNSILEIGCATGILTREIVKNFTFNEFSANDIVEDSKKYIDKIIAQNTFIAGDIEEMPLKGSYDLIISNACLQWCSDIEKTVLKLKKALNPNGILAVSVFGEDNLKEIKELFNIESNYCDFEAIQGCTIVQDTTVLEFANPVAVLKHLKSTGVNAVKEMRFTKSKLAEFEKEYVSKFSSAAGVRLTYCPVYLVIKA